MKKLLKSIGVTNTINKIICYLEADPSGTGIEKCYTVETEHGQIDFRIIKLSNGKTVSKIDYFDTRYRFNRNVNLLCELKGE